MDEGFTGLDQHESAVNYPFNIFDDWILTEKNINFFQKIILTLNMWMVVYACYDMLYAYDMQIHLCCKSLTDLVLW